MDFYPQALPAIRIAEGLAMLFCLKSSGTSLHF